VADPSHIRQDDAFILLDEYFETNGLVRQQLDSFNNFIRYTMQAIIDEYSALEFEIPKDNHDNTPRHIKKRLTVKFDCLTLQQHVLIPDGSNQVLTPHIARLRNMTYAADLSCDIIIDQFHYDSRNPRPVPLQMGASSQRQTKTLDIGKIPIMLHSDYCLLKGKTPQQLAELKECPYDQGGYFIVNGSEKVIVGLERAAANQVMVYDSAKGLNAVIASMTQGATAPPQRFDILQTPAKRDLGVTGFVYHCMIPKVQDPVPIGVLFRALGFISDLEILERIAYNLEDEEIINALRPSLLEAFPIQTQDVALDWIAKSTGFGDVHRAKRIEYGRDILQKHFLPHLGITAGLEEKKAYFLGYMCYKLVATSLKRRNPDDRDHFGNKRVDLSGELIAKLFRQAFYRLTKQTKLSIQECIKKKKFNIATIEQCISPQVITASLKYALATGNWTSDKTKTAENTGVAQELNRLTYAASLSHLRRSTSTVGTEGKQAKPRQLHNTQWGVVCVGADTEVVMGNGMDIELISNLGNGQSVTTINPTNPTTTSPSSVQIPSEITNWFEKPSHATHAVKTITLVDGRVLRADPEHPLYTASLPISSALSNQPNQHLGYLQVQDLIPWKHALLVKPHQAYLPTKIEQIQQKPIFTRNQVQSLFDLSSPSQQPIIAEFLSSEQSVIDQQLTFQQFNAIARILGYVAGSAQVDETFKCEIEVHNASDLTSIQHDLSTLDLPPIVSTATNSTSISAQLPRKAVVLLLVAGLMPMLTLGSIPQWIIESSQLTQREFLAAFFGSISSLHASTVSSLTLTTNSQLASHIRELLNRLSIKSDLVSTKSAKPLLTIDPEPHNIVQFFNLVGFRYSSHKSVATGILVEFYNILHCCPQLDLSFDKFAAFQINAPAGHIWIPIQSIEETPTEPLYDFTTLHNNHSFYANGIISHNCPAETPEGQACGIVKNMSLLCLITVGSLQTNMDSLVSSLDITTFSMLDIGDIPESTKVIVNGDWLGITENPHQLVTTLKELRRQRGTLSWDVTIYWSIEDKEVRLYSDPGRLIRPLFIVGNNGHDLKMKKYHFDALSRGEASFQSLLEENIIEYTDTLEEDTSMIAMSPNDIYNNVNNIQYTHCEIHPSMILGVCASIVPFPDHNQSPRNTYQSAMGKQAMGVYCTNFSARMDTLAHVFYYPQKPLVVTNSMDYIHFKELPAGTMAIVAIGCYTGYNQEDSVIMNQSAIDRGIYRSVYFKLFATEASGSADAGEQFIRPTRATTAGMTDEQSYSKLDADGFLSPGTWIQGAEAIVGKVTNLPPSEIYMQTHLEGRTQSRGATSTQKFKDMSLITKLTDNGVCDSVMITKDADNNTLVKMRTRSIRIPTIGDKFASRHGQKGTCGMTFRQEDMPFTKDGVTPDIIINPHAIPSRMTIGHLVECLLGKSGAITGKEGRATPFLDVSVDDIASMLFSHGYPKYGNEMLYSGFTGLRLQAPIFFGPTFYQRLKHLVDDKIHARARGKVVALTRQPTEGRSNDGGLRMGEMERDCFIAHGTANMLRDRLFKSSDYFQTHVCERCGLIAVATFNADQHDYHCRACSSNHGIARIELPYACKLLFQELMGMSIVPRIFVK
jgi:DNA-directed RNA polymerase beta subunit